MSFITLSHLLWALFLYHICHELYFFIIFAMSSITLSHLLWALFLYHICHELYFFIIFAMSSITLSHLPWALFLYHICHELYFFIIFAMSSTSLSEKRSSSCSKFSFQELTIIGNTWSAFDPMTGCIRKLDHDNDYKICELLILNEAVDCNMNFIVRNLPWFTKWS
jgi:hypothetical protein